MEEVLATGTPIRAVLASAGLEATSRGLALKAALSEAGHVPVPATDDELARLSTTQHPQGIIAVVASPAQTLERIPGGADIVVVVLDGIQDPGNVGTIVRTAQAFGAAGIVALPGTAEFANPKTLRASMGACFRMPLAAAAEPAVAAWLSQHRVLVVTASREGEPFDPTTLARPLALVLGNEGTGARSDLATRAARRVAIPMAPGVESLNVAVAAGILLHGVARER